MSGMIPLVVKHIMVTHDGGGIQHALGHIVIAMYTAAAVLGLGVCKQCFELWGWGSIPVLPLNLPMKVQVRSLFSLFK